MYDCLIFFISMKVKINWQDTIENTYSYFTDTGKKHILLQLSQNLRAKKDASFCGSRCFLWRKLFAA